MKPLSLILLALLSFKAGFTQNPLAERKIIPPSPDAAALGKYGEWPVDLCNGLVKIEIPLYTIKSRSLELPVSLTYHASGIRVNDISSWVGLGWALNAGGVVTRSVRGKMDEMGGVLNHAFTSTAQINAAPEGSNETIFNYLSARSTGHQDTESDAYSYNAGTISGSFVYDTDDNLVQVPLTDNKITANPGVSYTIISDDGTKYIFDVIGTTNINAVWDVPTSFYLSKMISADKTDTIYFEYTNGQYFDQSVSSSMSHYGAGLTQCALTPRTVSIIDYETKILQKIRFAGGYADFITTTARLDPGDVRLTDIKVYTNDNTLQKWIKFDHGYFLSYAGATHETAHRLMLDTVKILNKQGSIVARYGLVYNSTPLPPYYAIPSTHPSILDWQAYFGQDRWGYFNGVNTNTHFLDAGPGMCSGYANRSVSPTHAQACVLKEIHFPTGGKTIFSYQSNNLGMDLGGLRIHKVETYEANSSQPITRQYEYGGGFAGGNMMVLTSDFYYRYNQLQTYDNGTSGETIEMYVSQPTLSLSYSSNAAFYQYVAEYVGTPGINIGKTEYVYEAEQDDIITPGVNNYWNFPYLRYPQYVTSLGWSRGPLKFKREYSHDGTGGYIKVRETENIYQNYRVTNFKTGIMVFSATLPVDHALRLGANIQTTRNGYQYFDIPAFTWSKKLKQAITKDYGNGTELVKTTTFEYEAAALATNPHLLPTKFTNVTSEGNTVDKIYQYARDFTGTAPYDAMLTENIKSPVIKEVEKFNNTDNKGTHTLFSTYTGVGGNMYLPSSVKNYFKLSGWKDKLIIDQYDDRARLRQMHTANNINTCYIWDYNRQFAIAEVTHAAQADIAYSSFEGDDKGNFSFTSAATSDATAPTGKKCYLLTGSNNITKSGLTSGKIYIVSYWVKTSATPLTITGTQGTALQGKTIDGWTYFEHKVTGITTLIITASSRSIDELRLYPSGAQMITYTYDPVIGMTSRCDANNHVTYFEYDGSDWLKLVRDQDKNIIRTMHYNYKSGD